MPVIIYLHGLNSSPQSHKAQLLKTRMEQLGKASAFCCPALPDQPDQAIRMIEDEIGRHDSADVTFVGSSLGGYYATWLAEKHDLRAVLVNPAIRPHTGLRSLLGRQQNLHGGAGYELTEDHLGQLEKLFVRKVTPKRYLLLLETGDELLDYRKAVKKYRGCKQIIVEGGDHTLVSFPEHIPRILDFSRLAN